MLIIRFVTHGVVSEAERSVVRAEGPTGTVCNGSKGSETMNGAKPPRL